MIKVALIDNMNNNFFAMGRYLRDKGIDAHVFCLDSADEHFKPEADTFEDVSTLDYIHTLPFVPSSKAYLNLFRPSLKKILKPFDCIVVAGPTIAFLENEGIKIDIAVPFGSDLYQLPFFTFDYSSPIKSFIKNKISKLQLEGLKKSRVLIADDGYKLYKEALLKMDKTAFNLGLPIVYNVVDSKGDEKTISDWGFLDSHDFIVFNHSRQLWKTNSDDVDDFDLYGGIKRNDKLIKAFANFVKKTTFKKPILVLFEYGCDVKNTKLLIEELGIQDFIKWMPTTNRKYIMYALKKSTFSSNAFRENMNDIGGVCYESFASGSPHLNNCKEIIQNENHKFYASPMIHALSENDILNIFEDYEKNPIKYKETSHKSQEWFDQNLGEGLANKYIELIKLLVNNPSLNQKDELIKQQLLSMK